MLAGAISMVILTVRWTTLPLLHCLKADQSAPSAQQAGLQIPRSFTSLQVVTEHLLMIPSTS